jgi:hypothetical protein
MTKNKPTSYDDEQALQLALRSFGDRLSTTTQGNDAALRRAKRFAKFLARNNKPEAEQQFIPKEEGDTDSKLDRPTYLDGWNGALDAVLNLPAGFGLTQESTVSVSQMTAEIEKLRR